MLVLMRTAGERVIIGEGESQVIMEILSVTAGGKIRLGFVGPASVRVMRAELLAPDGSFIVRNSKPRQAPQVRFHKHAVREVRRSDFTTK